MTRNPSPVPYVAVLCLLALLFAACRYSSVQAQATGGDPCAANLKQLAAAVSAYTQDYDGALPPMGTATAADVAVGPYLPKPDAVRCPVTGTPYQPNAALSAQALAKLVKPNATYLFQDAVVHPNGKLTVLYADGHIAHLAKRSKKK